MIMTIVTGGLATTVFGLGFVPAIVGIIIGNVVGGIFMALHSAQGPQLGVAQMIQTRGQFGSFGALLIVVIVVVMYVGFFAANLVFGGEAMAAVSPGISVDAGIIIIGVVSVIATIFGYRLIHAYARVLSIAAGLALVLAFGWILLVHGLPASFLEQGNFNWVGFMGTISVAALWQLAYAPYVSDYSRYMPQGTGSAPAFWASYSGCVLGTLFPMILGALVGTLAVTMSSEAGDVEIVGSLGALAPAVDPDHRRHLLPGRRGLERHEPVLRGAVHPHHRADVQANLVATRQDPEHRGDHPLRCRRLHRAVRPR